MNASRFIARKLKFKGKIAIVAIAISFVVIIVAVSVSAGFRKELRDGISSFTGDIQLTARNMNILGDEDPVPSEPSYHSALDSIQGIRKIIPVAYRAGIVKEKDIIQGVLVKGIPSDDNDLGSLEISIPSRLSEITGLGEGDKMTAYFISGTVKVRRFTIKSVYPSILEVDDNLIVRANLADIQRLNGWEEEEVSALEIELEDEFKTSVRMKDKTEEIGTVTLLRSADESEILVATSVLGRYPQLFDWLDLIDLNVLIILILMSIVAGFNMISGLLILLFQNISTIGTLKSLGMNDWTISKIFIRLSSNLALKGMAIGNLTGAGLCLIQGWTHIVKLKAENYFVPYVPVSLDPAMIILADIAAYAVIIILLLAPCLYISRVDPAKTIRME